MYRAEISSTPEISIDGTCVTQALLECSSFRAVLIVMALATAVSAFITARQFDRADKLFLTWLLLGSGYVVAAIRSLFRIYAAHRQTKC
jgi:hypothetical protein